MKSKTSDVLLPEKYYVYILQSLKDFGLYIGFTRDLRKRLSQHAKGQVISTRLRRPFKLIHYEFFINGIDAKSRERYLKSGYGREQLRSILVNSLQK